MNQFTGIATWFLVLNSIILCYQSTSVNADDGALDDGLPETEEHKVLRDQVKRAEIQSCRGCSLNRLPEVKAFIYEDVVNYNNIEFKPIPGAKPELVLFTANNQELERIGLSQKSRKECNDLLIHWGINLKKPHDSKPDETDDFKVEL